MTRFSIGPGYRPGGGATGGGCFFLCLTIAALLWPGPARGGSFSLRGISFSDELGGFVLERVSGQGTILDPFVVVERLTNPDGATLVFRASAAVGNGIGSPDRIGFALVKVIKNATGHDWSSLEIELQSRFGIRLPARQSARSLHRSEARPAGGNAAHRPDRPADRVGPCGGGAVKTILLQSFRTSVVVARPFAWGFAAIVSSVFTRIGGRGRAG